MPSGAVLWVFQENSLRYHAELVPRIGIMLPKGEKKKGNSSAIQIGSSELNTYHFKEDLICFSAYLCPNDSLFQEKDL